MKHNPSADGLRGIAALCVIIAHFVDAFLPSLQYKNFPQIFSSNPQPSFLFKIIQLPFVSVFYNGHFAVLIFFVLSGYVLSMPYFINNPESLKKRIWGRYIRLNFPIMAALLIAFLVFKLHGYYNAEAALLSGSTLWLSTLTPTNLSLHKFISMALYNSILFGENSLLTTLWTLKIEFIGSIYLLLFYLCCERTRIMISTCFAALLLYLFYDADSLYYIALFLGALINIIKIRKATLLFFLGMYFGAYQADSIFFNFLPKHLFFDPKAFYNTAGAFFVVLAVARGFGKKFFELKQVRFLGKISFSAYLLHPIFLSSIACYLYIHFPRNSLNLSIIFLLYLLLTVIAARFFEKFVDRFSIKLSHKFSEYMAQKALRKANDI